jgi:hypothetical protein
MWTRDTVPNVWPVFLYFRFRSFPVSGSDHVTYAAWEWGSPLNFHGTTAPSLQKTPHCRGFVITLRHTTLGRTPLKTSDQSDAETSTWQHSQRTDIHVPDEIRIRNPSKRAPAYPRLRPRGPGIGSEICTAGNYKLALLLQLLTHRFSERNATRFPLAAKLFLCSKDLELTLQHDSKCKSYSLTLYNWTCISYCRA